MKSDDDDSHEVKDGKESASLYPISQDGIILSTLKSGSVVTPPQTTSTSLSPHSDSENNNMTVSQLSSPTTADHLPVLSEDLESYVESKTIVKASENELVRSRYMLKRSASSSGEQIDNEQPKETDEDFYGRLDRFGFIRSSEELERITKVMETREMYVLNYSFSFLK